MAPAIVARISVLGSKKKPTKKPPFLLGVRFFFLRPRQKQCHSAGWVRDPAVIEILPELVAFGCAAPLLALQGLVP